MQRDVPEQTMTKQQISNRESPQDEATERKQALDNPDEDEAFDEPDHDEFEDSDDDSDSDEESDEDDEDA